MSLIPDPAPAEFKLVIEASPHSEYTITLNGTALKAGTYRTEPLRGTATASFVVTWTDGEQRKTKTVEVRLSPGYHYTVTVAIPRVFPTMGTCGRTAGARNSQ